MYPVLYQRVYDEEVEETMPKADASEKQPEQVTEHEPANIAHFP